MKFMLPWSMLLDYLPLRPEDLTLDKVDRVMDSMFRNSEGQLVAPDAG